jgi:hypothetical protein
MMGNGKKGFFYGSRPGRHVVHGEASFDLPILYERDDFFGLYFSADRDKVISILPSDKLTPVTLPNGRAVVAIMAYNYIDTSIGPYGEIPVAIPVLFDRKGLPGPLGGLLPLMLQGMYPGFGVMVMHLPVTKVIARDAGRGEWGYTKFVADMDFSLTPEYLACGMQDDGQSILDLKVMRRGFHVPDSKPLITFSVKDRSLIRTVIPSKGVMRVSFYTKGSYVKLGTHPMAESIKALGISDRPFMQSFYTERAAILPSGEVVERNVKPFEGYIGLSREARHTCTYSS